MLTTMGLLSMYTGQNENGLISDAEFVFDVIRREVAKNSPDGMPPFDIPFDGDSQLEQRISVGLSNRTTPLET
jgi:hypothetical protein